MKNFLRIIMFLLFILSFGLLFVFYLYMHKENRVELEDIGVKTTRKVKSVKRKLEKRNKEMELELNQRQLEMREFIKGLQKDTFDIKNLGERFVDVSTRTIRRDLEKLEKSGVVRQIGKTRDSLYQISKD